MGVNERGIVGGPGDMTGKPGTGLDRAYEFKAVLLLSLAFGLVGLDRFILTPLFPWIAADLNLNYSDLGQLVGILAISWGVFAIVMGRVSDRIGRRKIIIPSLILFSLMSAFTGLAGGMVALLAIRAIMGAAEGAFLPASVAAVGEASKPSRRGSNQGLMIGASTLIGWGIGPVVATMLLTVLPSWREVFFLAAIPGLLLAFLLYRVIREPSHLTRAEAPAERTPRVPWNDMLRYRNVVLATTALCGAMCCVFVMGALVPNYMIDHLKLSPITMGLVMSAMGWGGFAGEFLLAALSDFIGRRVTSVIGFLGALSFTYLFSISGPQPMLLFGILFGVSFFGLGLLALLTGPVASEAVPPVAMSSAIGFVSGLGEVFGGGIAPIAAGFIAQNYGIANIFWVPFAGLTLGLVASFALRETAPRRVAAKGDAATA